VEAARSSESFAERPGPSRATVLVVFALSGFAAMLCEVGWTRVLALTIGSSVYGFTLMLAAFLAGLAGGAAVFARLASRPGADAARMLAGVLTGVGLACWATSLLFHELPYWFVRIFSWTGGAPTLLFPGEMALGLLLMAPATFMMGGVFPLVLRLHARREMEVGRRVGEAYAANTIGTVLGSASAGFFFLPTFKVRPTLLTAVAIDFILAAVVLSPTLRRGRAFAPIAAIAAAAGLWVLSPAWDPLLMNSGMFWHADSMPAGFTRAQFMAQAVGPDHVIYYEEGAIASVMVAREGDRGQLYLKINGKTEATSAGDLDTQVMLGQLPLLFHPKAKKALVIGLASGISTASAATHPLESIRVLEVEPAMRGAARCFDRFNRSVLSDPRVHLVVNDARNDLLVRNEIYDVIVSQPSNPWVTVAANLFTLEFFRTAKTRLAADGVFSQWVQTYGLSQDDVRALLATFRKVFPNVLVFETSASMADLVLLGSDRPLNVDYRALGEAMSDLTVSIDLARAGIRSPTDLISLPILYSPGLEDYVRGSGLNTDDNARIEFDSPISLYRDFRSAIALDIHRHRQPLPSVLLGLPEAPAERRSVLLELARALIRMQRAGAALEVLAPAEAIGVDDQSRRLRSAIDALRASG